MQLRRIKKNAASEGVKGIVMRVWRKNQLTGPVQTGRWGDARALRALSRWQGDRELASGAGSRGGGG